MHSSSLIQSSRNFKGPSNFTSLTLATIKLSFALYKRDCFKKNLTTKPLSNVRVENAYLSQRLMLDYITINTTSVIIKRRYTINTNVNAVNGLQQTKEQII